MMPLQFSDIVPRFFYMMFLHFFHRFLTIQAHDVLTFFYVFLIHSSHSVVYLATFSGSFGQDFLALDRNGDGTDGRDGRTEIFGIGPERGRDRREGRTEYSFTVLLGRRNTVLQYYLLFICLVSKPYFRYYVNHLVVST